MNKKWIYSFIKFGSKENLLNLMNEGEIYFNTIDYFTKIEDDFRGDIFEGASRILQGKNITKMVFTNSLGQSIDLCTGGYQVNYLIDRPKWPNKPTHLYCLYMLEDKNYRFDEPVIDERNIKFGNYALVIDPEEFINLISSELNNRKIKWKADNIEYVDINTVEDDYNIFKKPESYGYQNEYRFALATEESGPLKIRIGSLKKVSQLLEEKKLRSMRMVERE
jgi:hypothetical protein